MKKTIVIILSFFVVYAWSFTATHPNSTMEILRNNDWKYILPTTKFKCSQKVMYKDDRYTRITNIETVKVISDTILKKGATTVVDTTQIVNSTTTVESSFYLSDSITFSFDTTKIGKTINGRYIISHYDNDTSWVARVTEILDLNDSILIVKGVINPDPKLLHIGGPSAITYKAVKR